MKKYRVKTWSDYEMEKTRRIMLIPVLISAMYGREKEKYDKNMLSLLDEIHNGRTLYYNMSKYYSNVPEIDVLSNK